MEKYSIILSTVWVSMNYRNHWCLANTWNTCVTTFSIAWLRKLTQTSQGGKDMYILIAEHEISTLFSQLAVFKQTKDLLYFSFFFSLFFLFLLTVKPPGITLSVLLCVMCTTPIQGRWNTLVWLIPGQGWPQPNLIDWEVFFSCERKEIRQRMSF